MTRQFCDRCAAEITGKKSGSISGVEDADDNGGGTVTHDFDVCTACYRAFMKWMKQNAKEPKAQTR